MSSIGSHWWLYRHFLETYSAVKKYRICSRCDVRERVWGKREIKFGDLEKTVASFTL